MCMKVNEGEWREMNVYEFIQISIGQRVTALRLGAIPVINGLYLEVNSFSTRPSFASLSRRMILGGLVIFRNVNLMNLIKTKTQAFSLFNR